jgi:hypothetical protein
MRRAVLAIVGLCVCLSAVEAQAQVTLGLKGGLNLANLNVEDSDGTKIDLDKRTSFAGGAYLQAGLGSVLALQAEALYVPSGARGDNGAATIELSYIDIPLLALVRVPAGDAAIWPIVYAGPVLSFQTKCRLKADGGGSVDCGSGTSGLFQTKSPDISAAVGGGLEVFMGGYTLQLDIRYTHGFVNIDASEAGLAGTVNNRSWSFYLGLGKVLAP